MLKINWLKIKINKKKRFSDVTQIYLSWYGNPAHFLETCLPCQKTMVNNPLKNKWKKNQNKLWSWPFTAQVLHLSGSDHLPPILSIHLPQELESTTQSRKMSESSCLCYYTESRVLLLLVSLSCSQFHDDYLSLVLFQMFSGYFWV